MTTALIAAVLALTCVLAFVVFFAAHAVARATRDASAARRQLDVERERHAEAVDLIRATTRESENERFSAIIVDLQARHDAEINELRQSAEQLADAVREQAAAERAEHRDHLVRSDEDRQREHALLERRHSEELERLSERHELELMRLREAHQRELEHVHGIDVAELRRQHLEELERVRNEYRELLNRIQHPQLVPTGTSPIEQPSRRPNGTGQTSRRDRTRDAWNRVGQVAAPVASQLFVPTPAAPPDDGVGDDLP